MCNKVFDRANHLNKHLARKTPCAPILDTEDLPVAVREDPELAHKKCKFCGRVFTLRNTMLRHVRKYCKIAPNRRNTDAGNIGMELLFEHTMKKYQARLEQMETTISQLALVPAGATPGALNAPTGAPAAGATAQGSAAAAQGAAAAVRGDNNNVQVVNINFFGEEKTDYISRDMMRQIFEKSVAPGDGVRPPPAVAARSAVIGTAQLLYSNPEHPENMTCFMPNQKTDVALVHTAGGWDMQPLATVLPPMATRTIDELFEKQPVENGRHFTPMVSELCRNTGAYTAGAQLKPVLICNKKLLERVLGRPPAAGTITQQEAEKVFRALGEET